MTIDYLSMSLLSKPLAIIIPTIKTSEFSFSVKKAQLIVSLIQTVAAAWMPMAEGAAVSFTKHVAKLLLAHTVFHAFFIGALL